MVMSVMSVLCTLLKVKCYLLPNTAFSTVISINIQKYFLKELKFPTNETTVDIQSEYRVVNEF